MARKQHRVRAESCAGAFVGLPLMMFVPKSENKKNSDGHKSVTKLDEVGLIDANSSGAIAPQEGSHSLFSSHYFKLPQWIHAHKTTKGANTKARHRDCPRSKTISGGSS